MPLCGCCGIEYSQRTILRHLEGFRDRLGRQLDQIEAQAAQAHNHAGPAPENQAPGGIDLGDVGMDDGVAGNNGQGKQMNTRSQVSKC
jgi:hypothetical protein